MKLENFLKKLLNKSNQLCVTINGESKFYQKCGILFLIPWFSYFTDCNIQKCLFFGFKITFFNLGEVSFLSMIGFLMRKDVVFAVRKTRGYWVWMLDMVFMWSWDLEERIRIGIFSLLRKFLIQCYMNFVIMLLVNIMLVSTNFGMISERYLNSRLIKHFECCFTLR